MPQGAINARLFMAAVVLRAACWLPFCADVTTPVKLDTIRQKVMTNLEELYSKDPLKACRLALRRTINVRWQDRLDAIDKLLGNFGTEAIRGEWQNGYWCDIVAAYSNTGDTYDLTVIHVRGDGWNPQGRFIISSWGDWVERNERKYSIA